jgi:DNA-binding transcriptional ArsR family regulator
MSIKLITQVWNLDLAPREKIVLLKLADNANEEGTHCFPSIRRIAHETGKSVRSVMYGIKSLKEKGLVTVAMKGNQYSPNQYVLNLGAGKELPKFMPPSRVAAERVSARITSALVLEAKRAEQVQPTTGASARTSYITVRNHQ